MAFRTLFLCLLHALAVHSQVTVYSQQPLEPTFTDAASNPQYTGLAAYNPLILTAPPLPNPLPANQFGIQLNPATANVPGLSIPVSGSMWGFSVETSVITQVLGLNSSFIQVPFLNLMSEFTRRSGKFHIRVGGNTQETARFIEQTPNGKMIAKVGVNLNQTTQTPTLLYDMEFFYLLGNISALVPVYWYLGIPLNDTSDIRLEVAEYAQNLFGDKMLGFQVGNEPDLYVNHKHRADTYGPFDYFGEFGQVIQALQADPKIKTVDKNLIGPSVAASYWTAEQVFDTGFVPAYADQLGALSVENYPTDNCAAVYGATFGEVKVPQDEFFKYLDHRSQNSGIAIIQKFLNASNYAQSVGKPFLMFETNTASCGGFPGISNSFGAALWGVDYGLSLGTSNFTGGLLHVGGQGVYYNPVLPPPGGASYYQWTINTLCYSVLFVAEAFGPSGNARIIDLNANSGSVYTPAYAIYEGDNLARVALINYMTDPSGANDYTATISVGGGDMGLPNGVPAQVRVKYLRAATVAEQFDVTWAGQTFGERHGSDGRLKGNEDVQTVTCDQNANTCQIKVPAPAAALVFFNDQVLQEVSPPSTATFATTAYTADWNTAVANPTMVADTNGQGGGNRNTGSTSHGSLNLSGAPRAAGIAPSVTAIVALIAGITVLLKAFSR